MPRRQRTKRKSVSMRAEVYARLMHYVDTHQRDGASGSNVTEAALTRFLDAEGVPEVVAPHAPVDPVRPKRTEEPASGIWTF